MSNQIYLDILDHDYTEPVYLGMGDYGKVYKTYSIKYEIFFALKIIIFYDNQDYVSGYNEGIILNYLSSNQCVKYILCFYQMKIDEKKIYIATEYVDGYTIYTGYQLDLITDMPKLLINLWEGLKTIHKYGILHTDIHSGNIMVLPNHDVVFIDFGLACPIHDNVSKQLNIPTCVYTYSYDMYQLSNCVLKLFKSNQIVKTIYHIINNDQLPGTIDDVLTYLYKYEMNI